MGRSGCGKGTQAALLAKHFNNLLYISTGGLLRSLAQYNTAAGVKIKEVLGNGNLIPDFLVTGLWMHELCNNLKENQGVLFDGAPRRIAEAKTADRFFDFIGRKENFFPILIDISREEAFDRLTKRRICEKCGKIIPYVGEFKKISKCDICGGKLLGRADDNPDAINSRLDFFDKEVAEVIEYYKKDNRLIIVNGEQPIEDVFNDILRSIKVK